MPSAIRSIRSASAWLLTRLALGAVALGFMGRVVDRMRSRSRAAGEGRAAARSVLPSLLDLHPDATQAPRRPVGVRAVPIEHIVGTMRHPSQNTADFLPLPFLRGENWRARWQRIIRAHDRLETLPPVELVQVGDEYFVADGHNRVAAARRVGAVDVDADVTQLLVPGVAQPDGSPLDAASLVGSDSVRAAARGRLSRTVEQRSAEDMVSRQDLLREPEVADDDPPPAAP